MISQKNIFIVLFVAAVALSCIMAAVQASPVGNIEDVVEQPSDAPNSREGRFYGMGGSQASAFASANAGSTGFGGYPYGGGGLGIASASAVAAAGAGGMGYPYGK